MGASRRCSFGATIGLCLCLFGAPHCFAVSFAGGSGDGYDNRLESGLSIAPLDIDNTVATGVTDQAVWLDGTLVSTDVTTTVTLFYGTNDMGSTTNWQYSTNIGVQEVGPLSVLVTGLTTGATYYYRFYGTNASGHAWAWPSQEFYLLGSPAVTNDAASDVMASSATLNGTLTAGGYADTWIFWGQDTNNWANTNALGGLTQGAFSTDVFGLSADTVYYYRCFASNTLGTAWSQTRKWSYNTIRFFGGNEDGYDSLTRTVPAGSQGTIITIW